MDDKARERNREKVARYRARQKDKEKTYIGDNAKESLRAPARLDTKISRSVLKTLDAFAAATGTSKELITERALIEYFIKYKKFMPVADPNADGAPWSWVLPRKRDGEELPDNIYTSQAKGREAQFPPRAE